jgi:N-acyl-D-amino-acid deacylase
MILTVSVSTSVAAKAEDIPITGREDARLAAFDRLMLSFLRDHDVPGGALAIARHGRIVYARGFGYADVAKRLPVEPDSLFRIASLSKPITAAAIMQLQERGKLRLDDRACELLDLIPSDPRLAAVTVQQLLQHTAGFDRAISFDPMFKSVEIAKATKTAPPAGPEQIIAYMVQRKLDFDPGTRYCYSNFGYCMLGRIIERVSGQSYEQYVREQVLRPLGINRMRIGHTRESERAEGEVRYYPRDPKPGPSVFADGAPISAAYGDFYLEAMEAHGGWIASAPEIVRFASALDDTKHCPILKASSIAEMFREPSVRPLDAAGKPKTFYYACGWNVRPPATSERKLTTWHTGLLDGAATLLVRRNDGLAWAVLFNADNDKRNTYLSLLIDPMIHPVADGITQWPEGWEFAESESRGDGTD